MGPRLKLHRDRKTGQGLFFEPECKPVLILVAQQLALNLLCAPCSNPVALTHYFLEVEGRVSVQSFRDNVKSVPQPIEVVVFWQLETVPHALGYSLKVQCYWDSVEWLFSEESSNTVTLCPYCWLGMDPGARNSLSHARALSSESTSWQRPQLYQRDQAAEVPGSSESMLASRPSFI